MLPTIISKLIYKIGVRKRNPSLFRIYEDLKDSEYKSREELRALQLQKLQSFVHFAGEHSPYYREMFRTNGFIPNTINSFEDLNAIPVTDKKTLLDKCSAIHTKYDFPLVFKAETSGTTGNALEFFKNEEWDSTNRAALMRSYDWYNVNLWDYNGYLWGFNIAGAAAIKVRLFDFFQNRVRLFSYDSDEIKRFCKKLRSATVLSGYSSMIYEIAKAINNNNEYTRDDFKKLRLVKGTSETILDVYKTEVLESFGLKITSEYGAAEAGLIAFECPQGKLHINIENVYLETNEKNEAIVTNLVSHSFPVIRYNLGDIVELDSDDVRCECGREHPTIKTLSGRKGASVVGRQYKYPALTFYYVFKNLALKHELFLNYRAFQYEPGIVELKIEQQYQQLSEKLVLEQLHTYFSNDVDVILEWGANLETRRDKKIQYFNTTLG